MRKIKILEIVVGTICFLISVLAGVAFGFGIYSFIPLNEFRPHLTIISGFFGFVVANLLITRMFIELCPIPVGDIPPGSSAERNYNTYLFQLFWVIVPLNRCGLTPVPLTGLLYRLLGAKIGPGTYTSGTILDPHFVSIGSGTLLGFESLLVPHVVEGARVAHYPIRIGSHVTVGAHSIIMSDVEIGDRAIVAMNSVVIKGTRIGEREIWGGTPARLLQSPSRF